MKNKEEKEVLLAWLKKEVQLDTKVATKQWLKENKFKQKHAEFLIDKIKWVRKVRSLRHKQQTFNLQISGGSSFSGYRTLTLPLSAFHLLLQKKVIDLKQKRRKANQPLPTQKNGRILAIQQYKIDEAFGFLKATHGDLSIKNSSIPSYTVIEEDLGKYSSSCTYKKIAHNIFLNLPFKKFFKSQGNFFLGGTDNLWCYLTKTVGDIEIYRACWLKRGRGYNRSVVEGYILRSGETCYHIEKGKSLKRAISNLRNKLIRQRVLSTIPMFSGEVKFTEVKALLEKIDSGEISIFDNLRVYRSRSITAGNCVPGTDEFLEVHNLKGKKGGVSLREFCESRLLDNRYWSEKMATIGETIKKGYEQGKVDLRDLKKLASQYLPNI